MLLYIFVIWIVGTGGLLVGAWGVMGDGVNAKQACFLFCLVFVYIIILLYDISGGWFGCDSYIVYDSCESNNYSYGK